MTYKISVIIPTYNRKDELMNAINSVINQTYTNLECIIIDDFSTDGTYEKVESILKIDSRIKYLLNQRNKGAQGARNTGILNADGEFICFLDSDDILVSDSLSKRIDNFKYKNIEIVYGNFSDCNFLSTNNCVNILPLIVKNLSLAPFSVIMCRKSIFDDNLLDETYLAWQDDDFFLVNAKNNNIRHSETVVAQFNPNGNMFSITKNNKYLKQGLRKIIFKHWYLIFKTVGLKHLLICLSRYLLFSLKNTVFGKKILQNKMIKRFFDKMYMAVLKKFDVVYVR